MKSIPSNTLHVINGQLCIIYATVETNRLLRWCFYNTKEKTCFSISVENNYSNRRIIKNDRLNMRIRIDDNEIHLGKESLSQK